MLMLVFGASAPSTPKSLVTTVTSMFGSDSASWMAVVPESMAMVSPALTSAAARWPMRRFSSRCEVRLAS
ncbi:hypothetical protein D9M69_735110 [compost metagenome]